MRIASLLSIFDALLETMVIARAQFLTARTYGDIPGMVDAIETSLAVDQDLIAVLEGSPFEVWELGANEESEFPRPPGSAAEILELMRKLKRIYTASIAKMLKTIPHEIPELEERRAIITDHKMEVVGKYFRMLKKIMRKRYKAWKPSYDKEFSSMLNLRAPRKRR